MSRSNSWQPRRNVSILTAPSGMPCSQPPDNLIASREQEDHRKNEVCPKGASSSRKVPECEELEKMVFLRVLAGRPRHQQGHVPGDLMLLEAGLGKIAPFLRVLCHLDRLYTEGKKIGRASCRERVEIWV